MSALVDITGQRFGKLTVVERVGLYRPPSDPYHSVVTWRCVCDCGKEIVALGSNLKRGLSTSCGCKRHERKNKKKKEPLE